MGMNRLSGNCSSLDLFGALVSVCDQRENIALHLAFEEPNATARLLHRSWKWMAALARKHLSEAKDDAEREFRCGL
jgi:hypothetical protein